MAHGGEGLGSLYPGRGDHDLVALPGAVTMSDEDEAVLGESSIAPPVVDGSGAVIAAVAIVLPSTEWPPEDNVLNDLRETARNISRELGATAWPPHRDGV